MTNHIRSAQDLSDHDLRLEVRRLAGQERQATAQLIASLAEFDARRLYLGEGCASLFSYCTQVLHQSEHAAYGRIEAARVARRLPVVVELLANGAITLTTVTLLGPHLTGENHRALLDAARHKSRREVEQLVAQLRPTPDVPSSTRRLPQPKRSGQVSLQPIVASGPVLAGHAELPRTGPVLAGQPELSPLPRPARPAVIVPLAPARYKVQFTIGEDTYDKLRRAQDLLRHTIPNGDPAAIFDRALTVLLAEIAKTRLAATTRRRPGRGGSARRSRHIPAAVRRAVWTRDAGQCTFVGTAGRCTERGFLQFHHVLPYAAGGKATVDNIVLFCAAHNRYEAAQDEAAQAFGARRTTAGQRATGNTAPHQPRFVREARSRYGLEHPRVPAVPDSDSVRTGLGS